MRTTTQMSVTLPNPMAASVREMVQAGYYASESEVVRDGLRLLMRRERVLDDWLASEVAASFDATVANPQRALTAAQTRRQIGLPDEASL